MRRYITYVRKYTKLTRNLLTELSHILTSSLLISFNIRRDTTLSIVLSRSMEESLTLIIRGSIIKQLRADEESAMGFIKAALQERIPHIMVLNGIRPKVHKPIYCLNFTGPTLEDVVKCTPKSTLIIGDIELIKTITSECKWVSLYPGIYRLEDAVVIYHYVLDRCSAT